MALSKKEARIEILNLYWDKLCQKILCHAVLIKDTKMSALIKKLKKVQPNIRKALFEFYIQKCNALYSIAFFQWRKMYFENKESDEMI